MTEHENGDARREAAARARQDPVVFGPDPFAQLEGRPPIEDDESELLPRPRWPVIVGILIVVVVLVGAAGIWVR
jgi:hypothetical protein